MADCQQESLVAGHAQALSLTAVVAGPAWTVAALVAAVAVADDA